MWRTESLERATAHYRDRKLGLPRPRKESRICLVLMRSSGEEVWDPRASRRGSHGLEGPGGLTLGSGLLPEATPRCSQVTLSITHELSHLPQGGNGCCPCGLGSPSRGTIPERPAQHIPKGQTHPGNHLGPVAVGNTFCPWKMFCSGATSQAWWAPNTLHKEQVGTSHVRQ